MLSLASLLDLVVAIPCLPMTPRRYILRFQGFVWLFMASLVVTVLMVYRPLPQPSVPLSPPVSRVTLPSANPLEANLAPLHRLFEAAAPTTVEVLEAKSDSLESDASIFSLYDTLGESPRQFQIPAHPSNFGDRLQRDIHRRPVQNELLVVLHETTSSATSAIHQMLTPHPRDQDQVSYHALIERDGTILYTVDPRKRAYGAGDSVYSGTQGAETVKTNPRLASSVNNFAYHISLETPPDGRLNNEPFHSGYTIAQYQSLSWLIAKTGVSQPRIVTHAAIDQSGERQDPRSFDKDLLDTTLISQE